MLPCAAEPRDLALGDAAAASEPPSGAARQVWSARHQSNTPLILEDVRKPAPLCFAERCRPSVLPGPVCRVS